MKKTLKKLLIAGLAASMIFSTCLTAYADEADPAEEAIVLEETEEEPQENFSSDEEETEISQPEENGTEEEGPGETEEDPESAPEENEDPETNIEEPAEPEENEETEELQPEEEDVSEPEKEPVDSKEEESDDPAEDPTEDEESDDPDGEDSSADIDKEKEQKETSSDNEKIKTDEEEKNGKKANAGVEKGTAITGTVPAAAGMDVSTIRYYYNPSKLEESAAGENTEPAEAVLSYAFAEFSVKETGEYEYTFTAPYDGFEASVGNSGDAPAEGMIIAEYYNLSVWDGAVDVSWYDANASEYHIYTPAEFAGLAAIVNGVIDSDIQNYNVKGYRSELMVTDENRGLPDCIECGYDENASLGGPVEGPSYLGLEKYDFANKTVYLEADLYMGGGDGKKLDTEGIYAAKANLHDGTHDGYARYPNWTPIGGLFLTNVDDLGTASQAAFNGVLEGNGHTIYNLYCYRWSYPKPGTTAYGYADSTGVIGRLGYLYSEEEGNSLILDPAVRNLGLTGFVYGRRSVGGIVGRVASNSYLHGPVYLENLVNRATVYATDSKGVAGICGTFWNEDTMDGEVLRYKRGGAIINCYNRGNIRQLEYSGPAGGIVGENDSASIFCCYNTGEISTVSKMGRGIGSNDAGIHYTVSDCYYLEGHYDCDVEAYYGYYYQNADSSLSISTEKMNAARMMDGTLLEALNVNGTAYYAGSDGYPVLAWEAGAGAGTLSYGSAEGGTTWGSLPEGTYRAGTVVYLSNQADEDWTFRYYTRNDSRVSGNYVTVSGSTVASGYFQKSGRGYIEIPNNPICILRVFRVTGDEASGYVYTELKTGSEIVEGENLFFEAELREGMVPEDPDYEYRATAGVVSPFKFTITYTDNVPEETVVNSYTVTEAINAQNARMLLEVEALTTKKLWKNFSDTDWYEEGMTAYTITTARELAGVDKLIENEVTDFTGVMLTLGNDISLENTDGSAGRRWWDGIGDTSHAFAGEFDGAGYKITDILGTQNGLFSVVTGTSSNRAAIKNVSVYGEFHGTNASGIAGKTSYTDISNCYNFSVVDGLSGSGSSYSGGIVGYETQKCTIKNCINYGPVSGFYRVGGIVGESSGYSSNSGVMTDCFNYGAVSALLETPSLSCAGGLAGVYKGAITRCANYGNVRAVSNYAGGLVGQMTQSSGATTAKMTDCYNVGSVWTAYRPSQSQSTTYPAGAGGLMGYAARYVLNNCFNYGTVTRSAGCDATLGSFAGRYTTNDNNITKNVYVLDSSCESVLMGMSYEEICAIDKTDVAGIVQTDSAAYAAQTGVLAAINGNNSFVLMNESYPELSAAAEAHVHHGGTATCSAQAICEECGLPYGEQDPDNHIETEIRNALPAEWMQDGYTGDLYCSGCGELFRKGEVIPVDTSVPAITVSVTNNGETAFEKVYSVAEFDALKSTEPAGYQYGKTDGVTATCVASNRYVTLEDLLEDMGYSMDELISATVITSSSFETCTKETLLTRNLYVNADGTTKEVPAAIGIYYDRQSGEAEEIVKDAKLGSLIFLTGLSQEDIDSGSVGGFRLIMPVESVSYEVEADALTRVSLVSAPAYTTYHEGDRFCTDGLQLQAAYASGKTRPAGAYTLDKTGPLTVNDTEVTISFRGFDFTIPITVTGHEYDAQTGRCTGTHYDGSPCESVKERRSIENAMINGIKDQTYTGKTLMPDPVVTFTADGQEITLVKGTDYTVSYKNNKNAGTATVTVTGIGDYTGEITQNFTILKAAQTISVSATALTLAVGKTKTVTTTGAKGTVTYESASTATATVSSAGKITAKKVGTVKITATAAATDNYKSASKTITVKVTPAATSSLTAANTADGVKLTWKKVTGATGYKVYRGSTKIKTIKSASTVMYTDTGVKNGTKYTFKVVPYADTGDGTATSVTKTYLSRPVISSFTSTAAKKATVKWGKNAKANGYEIQFSLKSDFSSIAKKKTIDKYSTVSFTQTGLTSGKTCYVRVRSYKTVSGKKQYSAWSEYKKIKIK